MTKEAAYSAIVSILGLIANSALGGWDIGLKILIFCMVVDYVTGVLGAIKQHKLDSGVMFWGGINKSVILIVLALSIMLDELVGNSAPIFRTLAIYYYVSKEGLSVVENLGTLGVPLPDFLTKVFNQLESKNKGDDQK